MAGKSLGVVTTTSLTDATPAAAYAHVSDRNYQSSSPITDPNCKDIARQLVEDSPGANFSVILGGGTKNFISSEAGGDRKDGKDLLKVWRETRQNSGLADDEYRQVQTKQQLNSTDFNKVKYLMGTFSTNHMKYELQRNTTDEPSIADMTVAAIRVLSKSTNGFFLLVEGGNIDKAHHENWAQLALYDTLVFDDAINQTLNMVNLDETLVIVTADHSHGFTFNGYAKRDVNIFGFAEQKDLNNKDYTALLYSTGPGFPTSQDETLKDTGWLQQIYAHQTSYIILNKMWLIAASPEYRQLSATPLLSAAHSGEDVGKFHYASKTDLQLLVSPFIAAAYATGAMSHLMRSTQEQTYVAHIMSFAACVGPYQSQIHCTKSEASTPPTASASNHKCTTLLLACMALGLLLSHIIKRQQ